MTPAQCTEASTKAKLLRDWYARAQRGDEITHSFADSVLLAKYVAYLEKRLQEK